MTTQMGIIHEAGDNTDSVREDISSSHFWEYCRTDICIIMSIHFLLLLPLISRFWDNHLSFVLVHPWLSVHGSYRCLGQDDPCEGISLGACFVEPGSILKTYTATPDRCSHLKIFSKSCENFFEIILKTFTKPIENLSTRCSKLCEMNNNCEFWRAQWDGTLCHLLSSDYQHVSAQITLLQSFF